MRFERVDPSAFIEPASRILQEAWQSRCILYSPEYLRWQFTFPAGSSVGLAAIDGDEPVGFVAATLWRLRLRHHPVRVWIPGFGAVRPGWQGGGAAGILWRTFVKILRAFGLPVIAFSQLDSRVERFTLKVFRAGGFQARNFGDYRTYAWRPQGSAGPTPPTCSISSDDAAFLEVARRCLDPHTLWHDLDAATLGHYARDPRSSVRVLVRGPQGEAVGAALLARSEVVTAAGIEFHAAVESIFLPEPSAEILTALFCFAAAHYAGKVSSPVVLAPNLWGIDPAILRLAGVRATPSAFRGHLYVPSPGDDPFAGTEGTNVEIGG
jgi:hypothetical protein